MLQPGQRRSQSQSKATPDDDDPRAALARQYLQNAEAKLAEEEAEKRRTRPRRRQLPSGTLEAAPGLSISIDNTVIVHMILVSVAITVSLVGCALTYFIIRTFMMVDMIIGIAAGIVVAAALSYLSVCYLGIIESTSRGHTTLQDTVTGDWREWFWTLPMSLGMLAAAGGIGWLISLGDAGSRWPIIGITTFVLYPYLQLSALVNTSPLQPFSGQVLRSMGKKPLAWFAFYVVALALTGIVFATARLAWADPPYLALALIGPATTVSLFVYAWLLGQLARTISSLDM